MAKVYLETSFFSACATTRTDVDSLSWKGRSLSWLKTQAQRHELFTSVEVIAELSAPTYPSREVALGFAAGIVLLPITAEVMDLARLLVEQQVMPGPLAGDAVHVATTAYHGID